MKCGLRVALGLIVVSLAAVTTVSPTAHAAGLKEIRVAHRGASNHQIAEGTLASYRYAVKHHADILDGDVRWTKDSRDRDSVGTMVIFHDKKMNRITKCSGDISKKVWSTIRDKCHTRVGNQQVIRLYDLLKYAKSAKKPVALQIKLPSLTNAQAKQFWNMVKNSNVVLEGSAGQLPSMRKIKKLDKADRGHKINYALVESGSKGWPSARYVKSIGTSVHLRLEAPKSVVTRYKKAGLKVFIYTGKTNRDYERMAKLAPNGVVVDDVAKFQRWRDRVSGA